MAGDHQHLDEGARVDVTPAPAPTDTTTPPETTPTVTSNPLKKLAQSLGLLGAAIILSLTACVPAATGTATSSHADQVGMNDGAQVAPTTRDGIPVIYTSDDSHPVPTWKAHLTIEKRWGSDLTTQPYEIVEADHNLLTTNGANTLWSGLTTAGLATPFNSTNATLCVGDGSTAAAIGDTDCQGTSTSVGTTTALSSTASVMTYTVANTLTAGQVVVTTGATPAGYNGTFVVATASSTNFTVNSTANPGAGTVQATVNVVNKFRQLVNGAPTVSTNQVQFVAVYGTANANFPWNNWGTTNSTGLQVGGTLLNHAIPAGGLGTKTSAASWTLTVTLTLS